MNRQFLKEMKSLLPNDYEEYKRLLDEPAYRGYRINNLKIGYKDFFKLTGFAQERTPFAKNSFYYLLNKPVINNPAYCAGLFYMQEPSASAPVASAPIKKGMNILDLCAAPGSKTTQIAEFMDGDGLLVANEIDNKRAKILLENVERHGISNCLVLNNSPEDLEDTFTSYFDMIFVDAPCSGEGMMRKNDEEIQWSIENVNACAIRQRNILESAYKMLRPGGYIMYSTCTFNRIENEDVVYDFVNKHYDMEFSNTPTIFGRDAINIPARRIYPMDGGEGQFLCLMHRTGELVSTYKLPLFKSDSIPNWLQDQLSEIYYKLLPNILVKDDRVYAGSMPFVFPEGCHIMRHQVFLGFIKNNRFEPSYASAMNADISWQHEYEIGHNDFTRYMRGESIKCDIPKGFYRVTWNKYPIGLGKSDGTYLKNKLPKQYRLR